MTGELDRTTLDYAAIWQAAEPFPDFLDGVRSQRSLWEGVYRTATLPDWAVAAFSRIPGGLRLLVLNADWCLDSANSVPVLARLAEAVPGIELRLLERDDFPDVMDRYLTNGSRSIPLAILLDQSFHPVGRWGPRPAELQQWVLEHKATIPKEERYRFQRRWYAVDRGETTLREVLAAAGAEQEVRGKR